MGMSLHFEPIEVIQVLTDVDSKEVNALKGRFILSQQNSPINEQKSVLKPTSYNNYNQYLKK